MSNEKLIISALRNNNFSAAKQLAERDIELGPKEKKEGARKILLIVNSVEKSYKESKQAEMAERRRKADEYVQLRAAAIEAINNTAGN
jgi:hypothetical protein